MSIVDEAARSLEDPREKAAEQDYFDVSVEARQRACDYWDHGPVSGSTPAEREAFLKQRRRHECPEPGEAVAHGRIDAEDGTKLYIGRRYIKDEDGAPLVISWKTKAAVPFYQATPVDPQGLARKRTFESLNNHVIHYTDTWFVEKPNAEAPDAHVDEPTSSPEYSDVLLEALEANRSGEMKDIVLTIMAAQDRIIRADKDQLLVVQGGPGTGKTAVALHRVSWLLYNFQDTINPEDVLVVGPNPTFTKYIRKVLPDLGDKDVVQRSLHDFMGSRVVVTATESPEIAAIKGSARMADVISAALYGQLTVPTEPIVLKRQGSGAPVTISAGDAADAVRGLRAQKYDVGRRRLRARLAELGARQLGWRGIASFEDLFDAKSLEGALNALWPEVNAVDFIRGLLGSVDALLRAGVGILGKEESALLYRPVDGNAALQPWTLDDLALIDEAQSILTSVETRYAHIVVDEAQDLSEMQLRAVRRRSKTGSMTVVGDIAQSTGAHARDSWVTVLAHLRSDLPSQIAELEHGYRVPSEVFDVARPVLALAAPNVTPPDIVRTVGSEPSWIRSEPAAFVEDVLAAARGHASLGRFVGIIADQKHWPALAERFRADGMTWSQSDKGQLGSTYNLVSPHDAKGLEFDAVVLADPATLVAEPHGHRLLYIALTRTTKYLDVVFPRGTLPEVLRPFTGDAPEAPEVETAFGGLDADEELAKLGPVERTIAEQTAAVFADQIRGTVQDKLHAAVVAKIMKELLG
ncbi:HelD family protein [Sinomonas flava]|uniref:AAA family ATPase n=1 Tax=Sinomonas flava TaxID=496857 RepID=A0ABN3BTE7_9MICC